MDHLIAPYVKGQKPAIEVREDGGALAVTVGGKSVKFGPDGRIAGK